MARKSGHKVAPVAVELVPGSGLEVESGLELEVQGQGNGVCASCGDGDDGVSETTNILQSVIRSGPASSSSSNQTC